MNRVTQQVQLARRLAREIHPGAEVPMNARDVIAMADEIKRLRRALVRLAEAAQPFTSGDVVDETSGTIPLMDALGDALRQAAEAIGDN